VHALLARTISLQNTRETTWATCHERQASSAPLWPSIVDSRQTPDLSKAYNDPPRPTHTLSSKKIYTQSGLGRYRYSAVATANSPKAQEAVFWATAMKCKGYSENFR